MPEQLTFWERFVSALLPNLCVAFIVAFVGYVIWRMQTIYKRRFEVAEDALILFSELEASLYGVRYPIFFEIISDQTPSEEILTHDQKRVRAVAKSLRSARTTTSKTSGMQRLCEIHLGLQAAACFQTMDVLFVRVAVNAAMLRELLNGDTQTGADFLEKKKKYELIVYSDTDGTREKPGVNDHIGQQVLEARKALEKICRRYLSVNLPRKLFFIPKRKIK